MIPELEKPRVTEIQVRMDCNGCVQKIKKALYGINGIYDLYIDFPQQKLTIIGWADPEKIMKAIKKTRKIATICSHTEPTDPATKPPEQAPEGGGPPPAEAANPPPAEAPQAEAAPPAEPPKDPPPPENPPPEATPAPAAADANAGNPARPKDVEEVHVIYHHPPEYGYRYGYGHRFGGHWNNYSNVQGLQQEPPPTVYTNVQGVHHEPPPTMYTNVQGLHHEPPPPVYVTHRYNTYKPPPYITEYEYIRSPPRHAHYSRMDRYSEDYRNVNNSNGNITSMFSDENPNACRIV